MKTNIPKITPSLTFNDQAEEAANFYTSVFNDGEILSIVRYGEGQPGPAGTVCAVTFQLQGQEYMAVNGGPSFKFTEGISLYVNCETQDEIDDLWAKLSTGGETIECGWLKDKFGVYWQIAPVLLWEMMKDPDVEKVQRVMSAIFKMVKLDIETLKRAYEGAEMSVS